MDEITYNTVPDVIKLVIGRFQNIAIPDAFANYLVAQEQCGHRLHRVETGESLTKEFLQQGIAQQYLSPFLSSDSKWQLKIDYSSLIKLSSEEVYTFFLDRFSYLFYLQDRALENETSVGFNRHGRDHVRFVVDRTIELVKRSTKTDTLHSHVINEAIVGAFLHDIGNLISRKHHSFYGTYIVKIERPTKKN